jgi:alpha-galactosidase
MMESRYTCGAGPETVFATTDSSVFLRRLFAFSCGCHGEDSGLDRVRGLLVLDTDAGRVETHALTGSLAGAQNNGAALTWEGKGVRIRSDWDFSSPDGIVSRRDRVTRLPGAPGGPMRVRRAMARFVFAPGGYEVFTQESRWCHESQGEWRDARGGVDIASEGSRTCMGAAPYIALRDSRGGGIAFHLVPRGNWKIRLQNVASGYSLLPHALVLEMGFGDETMDWLLEEGASMEMPEILMQHLPGGRPHELTAPLHRYLLSRRPDPRPVPPVIYNTWYDVYDKLDVQRLRGQLAAARKVGCEVFMVDAGWYGQMAGPWSAQVGDFREKLDGAFHGRMAEFAREVRAAGMGFGIWVEPERLMPGAPVVAAHPDWFAPSPDGCLYPRLTLAAAREYTYRMIADLVERYDLRWIKIDMNHELGYDPDGREFAPYLDAWYGIVDALSGAYPRLCIEGCQSGALRMDLNAFVHHDVNFLSDNMNPFMSSRIYEQGLLRYPPGYVSRWLCLRPAGTSVEECDAPFGEAGKRVIVAGAWGWERAEVADIDQAFAMAFPGVLGLSGDIAGLAEGHQEELARWIGWYKEWRGMIRRSAAHLLTAPGLVTERRGHSALQLVDAEARRSLLFLYWHDLIGGKAVLRPRGLAADRLYTVRTLDGKETAPAASGRELEARGITLAMTNGQSARVVALEG